MFSLMIAHRWASNERQQVSIGVNRRAHLGPRSLTQGCRRFRLSCVARCVGPSFLSAVNCPDACPSCSAKCKQTALSWLARRLHYSLRHEDHYLRPDCALHFVVFLFRRSGSDVNTRRLAARGPSVGRRRRRVECGGSEPTANRDTGEHPGPSQHPGAHGAPSRSGSPCVSEPASRRRRRTGSRCATSA